MNKSVSKKPQSPLKVEVTPAVIAILVTVLVVLFGGYFALKSMQGPKILTGNSGATMSHTAEQEHAHTDEFTGKTVNRD